MNDQSIHKIINCLSRRWRWYELLSRSCVEWGRHAWIMTKCLGCPRRNIIVYSGKTMSYVLWEDSEPLEGDDDGNLFNYCTDIRGTCRESSLAPSCHIWSSGQVTHKGCRLPTNIFRTASAQISWDKLESRLVEANAYIQPNIYWICMVNNWIVKSLKAWSIEILGSC